MNGMEFKKLNSKNFAIFRVKSRLISPNFKKLNPKSFFPGLDLVLKTNQYRLNVKM